MDTVEHTLTVFAQQDGLYEVAATVRDEPVELDFGVGRLRVDLPALLA